MDWEGAFLQALIASIVGIVESRRAIDLRGRF
jgi:hypothetical protein